jgi:hypothetical protein
MKSLAAILLLVGGAGLIVVTIYHALVPLVGLYEGAMTDPLGQPADAEQDASRRMLDALLTGLPGVVMFLLGVVWLKILAARRAARRL